MSRLNLDTQALTDLANIMLGHIIGQGASRTVYASRLNENHVIKVAREGDWMGQNTVEHLLWFDAEHTGLEKWLAPVVAISPCHRILIMERGETVSAREVPKKIPACLTDDHKPEAWVRLKNGRVVRCDYGVLPSMLIPDKQELVAVPAGPLASNPAK